jgi:hypothetical protein
MCCVHSSLGPILTHIMGKFFNSKCIFICGMERVPEHKNNHETSGASGLHDQIRGSFATEERSWDFRCNMVMRPCVEVVYLASQRIGKFLWPHDHVAPCGIIVKMLMVCVIPKKSKSYYFISINFLSTCNAQVFLLVGTKSTEPCPWRYVSHHIPSVLFISLNYFHAIDWFKIRYVHIYVLLLFHR